MKTIRLWADAPGTRHLMRLLCHHVAGRFVCHETAENPDFLFYSGVHRHELLHPGVRIFITGENLLPDFNTADYAIGFAPFQLPGRYLRWPLFRLYDEAYAAVLNRPVLSAGAPLREGFCACVVSNMKHRQDPLAETADALSRHLPLSYGGAWRNSTNGPVADKHTFLLKHRFSLAFENTSAPGYTTEKLLESLAARTIPIYWGDPLVAQDFNPAAFINAADFPTPQALADHVAALDRDPARCLDILNAPVFRDNIEPPHLRSHVLADFLTNIFDSPPDLLRRSTGRWPAKYEAAHHTAFFQPCHQALRLLSHRLRRLRGKA